MDTMKGVLWRWYEQLVLKRPWLVLLALFLVIAGLGSQSGNFKLDASADSLVLEDDDDLKFFRTINRRYGVAEFLVLTWSPDEALFSHGALARLRNLKQLITQTDGVQRVMSILDLPLLDSPRIKLSELSDDPRTLEMPDTDLSLAQREFLTSPLYKDLVISADGKTTMLLIFLDNDPHYDALLSEREALRDRRNAGQLDETGFARLEEVSRQFKDYQVVSSKKRSAIIKDIRQAVDRHRSDAKMFLGGAPMIVADMIDMIESDLVVFGTSVVLFLIFLLIVIFRDPRWVILPMMCCSLTVAAMIGLLGLLDWRVTVVSSNFVALLLIIAMSMTIHLCVRMRELQAASPDAPTRGLLNETVHFMFKPCVYTSLTTIVAFVSLVVSGIRPVIDFGHIMTLGIVLAFMIIFTLFPSFLGVLPKGKSPLKNDFTTRITLGFAHITQRHYRVFSIAGLVLLAVSAAGISRLEVENRFIDYFHDGTEIHRGMLEIDRKLGGTTPLDVIVRAPEQQPAEDEPDEEEDLYDDYLDDTEDAAGYWMTPPKVAEVKRIHDFFERQGEIGKVMSLATLLRLAEMLNKDRPLNDFDLVLLERVLSDDIKDILYNPYVSEDGNELRFNMRVIDSNQDLKRAELIERVEQGLRGLGYEDANFRVNGMLVLYNNMLQSLYESQIMTIGMVFLAIMGMFIILFRSLLLAVIAILPNILPAALVLGFMGWRAIPLDMMTITIAAISVGIAVDNTIHYIIRFKREFPQDRNYFAAIDRCHKSIGKAMYYTSTTIIFGFSILSLSNFIPTIYFGLLTGVAMLVALVASLTLLPSLLLIFKPLGKPAPQ